MALTEVEEAILKKAQEEADAIIAEAEQKADAHLERESARLREEHERRIARTRAELEAALDRETGTRKTQDRLEILKVKNEIIEEVFRKTVEGIVSLPDGGYEKWLKGQISRLPRIDGAEILANDRDRETVGKILGETKIPMKLSEESAPIKGGFLVRGRDADLDYSVEALLGVLRESLAEEVAAGLFGDADRPS